MFVVEILDVPITELVEALDCIGADLLTVLKKHKGYWALKTHIHYPNV